MEIFQAFKFELMPNGRQRRLMARFAGCKRWVWNKALDLRQQAHKTNKANIGFAQLCKEITAWRHAPETSWLSEAPVHPLQQALKDLDAAYKNFFEGRGKFPQFKRKGESESFRYPDPVQFKLDEANGRVFLPKLGWMRYRKSRDVEGELRNVTISLHAGKWSMAMQTRRDVECPVPKAASVCGVDLGVARFATLDDGSVIEGPNSFKRHQERLAKYQRRMARKKKFSKNWGKAKKKVQRLQAKIANVRKDFLHKATTQLADGHACVIVEDLKVKNMTASAKGTLEAPGKNVKQKSGLNRSILDQGWGMFRTMLEWKMARRGGLLLAVPPMCTSQTCPRCKHVSADNRKSQARFECVACGFSGNADHVAAMNIREAGCASLACQASGEAIPPATGTLRSGGCGPSAPASPAGIPVV